MKRKDDRQGLRAADAGAEPDLRQRAEEIASHAALATQADDELSLPAMQQTLHELRVHQIELEMQNDELRRAQAQLETARERYFDLYDLAPVGYCTLGVQGLILQANLTATHLLNVRRVDLLNQPISRFILREDQDAFYHLRKQLVATGEPQSCELRLLRNAGEPFWARLQASSAQNEQGAPVLRIIISDCHAQKQAEDALQDSYQALNSILQTTLDGFWRFDPSGRLLDVNPAYCAQSGYHRDELLSLSVFDLEAEQSPMQSLQHMQKMIVHGHDLFESRHRRKDGALWDVEVSCTYQDVAGGQFFAFLRDITARKQSEASLQLAASVFAHAREGIMITAIDGTIINVNAAFSRITGYRRDEALGQTPRLLSSGRQSPEFYETMWRSLHEKGHWYGEVWNRRKSGEIYPELQTISTVRDEHGNPLQYVSLFSDITEVKAQQSELERIAHYDALTALPNRVLLADRLRHAIAQAQRRGQLLEVVFLDLDGFKAINDQHGHEVGDQVLITLANSMKQALRECDTLARLGGDEFVAVLVDLPDVDASLPMLARLLAAAAVPVHLGELKLQVSASMGVTCYPQMDDVDADQLLRQADQAMYQAKLSGKNRMHFFDIEQDRSVRGHHESLEHIAQALAAHEFVLYYQPRVNMRTGAVVGAEALIRWQHPQRGLLLPVVFMPVIEEHALAIDIGEWVIDSALGQISAWQRQGLQLPVSVNISARQLQQKDFVERLRAILADHPQVEPAYLILEVLETSALEDMAHVSRVIQACREIGVMFALDDFGTGYSSLTYLKRLPIAQLKIDQSFVRDMLDDPDDLSILKGVIGLASAFRLHVNAEGVETVEHGAMLLQLGCELAQGYGIAYPMPGHEMPGWAASWWRYSGWSKLPTLGQEDLPMLFAGVEHRAWLKALEAYLHGERSAPPPLDQQQSHFGRWLTGEGLLRHGRQPAFAAISALHQRAHQLASELCEQQARGRSPEVLARLDELHELQEGLFDQLKLLVLASAQ